MRYQWIALAGGCCLAFGAAFANMGLLLRTGTSVSHLTGDVSKLSMDLVRTSPEILSELLRVAVAALSFFIGAFIAGFFIHHPSLDFARPYGRTVTGIGLLLIFSYVLISVAPVVAISLSAFACGLQNSLATRYRGIILRTTHLTGLITDFGITLGMRVRGFDIPAWKIAVPALLTGSFVLGCIIAAALYLVADRDPVLIAGVAYVGAGILWTVAKHFVFPELFKDHNHPGSE